MKTFYWCITTFLWLSLASAQDVQLSNIEIIRDQWGVPHIFAPTDEEVAYGLAWATAEDDFTSVQENLLAVRGRLAEVKGKEGAIMDYLSALLGTNEVVDNNYPQAISPKFRLVLEFYCKGMNDYAAKHPEEVLLKGVFPVGVKDMLSSYVLGMALMTNVQYSLLKVSAGTIVNNELKAPKGSNAFALNASKTGTGETFLAINSHQPLSGPFSWYEAHLQSEEGWNILGGTFPGGATIFHGVNQNLGWAHTVTMSDLVDVYQLEMHPDKKLMYRYDGKWLSLEEKQIKMKVKVLGKLKIPIKKSYYKSVYGPTMKGGDGHYYSFRLPATMDIRAPEQWYRMNKATNFNEFYEAVKIQGIAGLNFIYADKEDNIFYLDNGKFPERNPNYDWWDVLPGDTSATLWANNSFYPLDALAQVKNPDCGYVFNTNNTPFFCTGDECKNDMAALAVRKSYFQLNNNRSLRLQELMEQNKTIDYGKFKEIKYDLHVRDSAYTFSIANLEELFHLDAQQFPDLSDVIAELSKWDRNADTNSTGATVLAIFIQKYIDSRVKSGNLPIVETHLDSTEMLTLLKATKAHLMKYFNSTNVKLGTVQKLVRGNKVLAVSGIPDVIAAMNISPYEHGVFKAESGESYIMLVRFTSEGPVIETINAYGSSNKKNSPHYNDQMELFVRQKLKPMTLDKATIQNQAERKYHPGQ